MNGTSIAPSQIILLRFLFKLCIAPSSVKCRDDENLKLKFVQSKLMFLKITSRIVQLNTKSLFFGTKYLQSRFECEDVFMPEKVNLKLRKRRFDLTHTIYLEKAETQAPRKPIRLVHVTKV